MKALLGPVTNIRPVKSQGVTRIEIEVPIEAHVPVTEFMFNKTVLVTLAPPSLQDQAYGLISPASDGVDEFDPLDFVPEGIDPQAIVTFAVGEDEAKDLAARGWGTLGPLCQSAIMLAKTETFQVWTAAIGAVFEIPKGAHLSNEELAATYIRQRCGVKSRKELDESDDAKANFRGMMNEYRTWLRSQS